LGGDVAVLDRRLDVIESTFELAMPGGDFESYTHERLTQVRS
jgi:hypothetical protein